MFKMSFDSKTTLRFLEFKQGNFEIYKSVYDMT